MRKPKPEEVFVEHVKKMINNLLIDNPNYRNNYYYRDSSHIWDYWKLLDDTKERARYILEEIEKTRHLVEEIEENDPNAILNRD